MKKNILIVGATGYIGKKLKKKLKKKYNLITPNKKKFNLLNYQQIKKFLSNKINLIINLSGQISGNKILMKKIIINGNKNLIKICQNKKIKVFYLSTSLIYGYSKKKLTENSKKKPIDDYAKFKLIAEEEYLKSNIDFIILRLCNIFNGKNKGIIKIIQNSIKKNKKIYLTNKNVSRNYVHINDAINIITKMIEKKLHYKIYNIGNENIQLVDLIKHIEKKFKIKINYSDKKEKLKEIPSQKISVKRIFNEIKYKPKENIKKYIIKKFYNELRVS